MMDFRHVWLQSPRSHRGTTNVERHVWIAEAGVPEASRIAQKMKHPGAAPAVFSFG